MFAFFTIVQTMRLVLIGLRTVASIIILGHGVARWAKNNRRVKAA